MRRMMITLALALGLSGCSEGCANVKAVDYGYRQDQLTLHRVTDDHCVVVLIVDQEVAAMASVPCPIDAPVYIKKGASR